MLWRFGWRWRWWWRWFHCDYIAYSAQLHWDLGWAWQKLSKFLNFLLFRGPRKQATNNIFFWHLGKIKKLMWIFKLFLGVGGWVLKMKLMLSHHLTKLKLKLKLSLATKIFMVLNHFFGVEISCIKKLFRHPKKFLSSKWHVKKTFPPKIFFCC